MTSEMSDDEFINNMNPGFDYLWTGESHNETNELDRLRMELCFAYLNLCDSAAHGRRFLSQGMQAKLKALLQQEYDRVRNVLGEFHSDEIEPTKRRELIDERTRTVRQLLDDFPPPALSQIHDRVLQAEIRALSRNYRFEELPATIHGRVQHIIQAEEEAQSELEKMKAYTAKIEGDVERIRKTVEVTLPMVTADGFKVLKEQFQQDASKWGCKVAIALCVLAFIICGIMFALPTVPENASVGYGLTTLFKFGLPLSAALIALRILVVQFTRFTKLAAVYAHREEAMYRIPLVAEMVSAGKKGEQLQAALGIEVARALLADPAVDTSAEGAEININPPVHSLKDLFGLTR